ncbi:hypothetical protein AVEN_260288-1 [Araneus ventricosus]|uniref:Uncharacterized protein n=1 Tax=Araneus ventricosus TaxID=182803 RepID=A0A4Y2U538_ARAVE|nr:hypothetical protein AVEN_260288-1 [Araneus ventricosus]
MIVIGRILCISPAVVATLVGTLLLKNTIVTGSPICSEYEFPCENGEYIESELWCNSLEDCSDGSDEKYCEKSDWFKPGKY